MKSKTITFLLLAATSLTMSGCAEEVCKLYAPADKEISWTDYNTVTEVNDYFECYQETYRMHIGDTMKVMGYLIPGTWGVSVPFNYDSQITADGEVISLSLGDYVDVPHNEQGLVILSGYLGEYGPNDVEIFSKFRDYQWGQKVYATVIIVSRSVDPNYCCDYLVCKPIEAEIVEEMK